MKILFYILFAIASFSLLTQWARGFAPRAVGNAFNAALTRAFHRPVGSQSQGVLFLANAKLGAIAEPAPFKVVRRTPKQQERYLANLLSIERLPFAPVDQGQMTPGEIYLANESRFNENFFHEKLTNYAVGFKDPNDIEMMRKFVAPEVEVQPFFEYKSFTNAEEFVISTDDARPIGKEYRVLEPYTATTVVDKTIDRGLTLIVDLRTVRGQSDWELKKVEKIKRRIARIRLKRAVALLSAAATNTAKTWDVTAGKDPDMDVITEGVTGRTASGIGFNRIVYGDTAWAKRLLSLRAQNLAGQGQSSSLSRQDLAGLLNVDRIEVSRERYQSAAATKTEIVNNLALMFDASDDVDTEDPSNIKCFISRYGAGEPGAGLFMRVFVQAISANLVALTVSYEEVMKITSTLGIRKFTVS
jgi:hypothetical protein